MDHLIELFSDDALVAALAAELSNNSFLIDGKSKDEAFLISREFGASWFQMKGIEGVGRLSVSEQRNFYKMAMAIVDRMSVSDCAATFRMNLDAVKASNIEMKIVSSLGADWASRYLALNRAAVRAEITHFPVELPLTPSERKFADEAFMNSLLELTEQHPQRDALLAAADMSESSSDEHTCAFGKIVIAAALNVRGDVGDWVIRSLDQ